MTFAVAAAAEVVTFFVTGRLGVTWCFEDIIEARTVFPTLAAAVVFALMGVVFRALDVREQNRASIVDE